MKEITKLNEQTGYHRNSLVRHNFVINFPLFISQIKNIHSSQKEILSDMQEKLSLLKELIKLASSDKDVRENEYHFIVSVAKMLGIGHQEVDSLFAENIDVVIPETESSRILQFYRMILLMNVDHEVNSKEMNFVRSAGLRLGLRPMAVEWVFEEMKKNERGMIPEDKLIEIFTTYRN